MKRIFNFIAWSIWAVGWAVRFIVFLAVGISLAAVPTLLLLTSAPILYMNIWDIEPFGWYLAVPMAIISVLATATVFYFGAWVTGEWFWNFLELDRPYGEKLSTESVFLAPQPIDLLGDKNLISPFVSDFSSTSGFSTT